MVTYPDEASPTSDIQLKYSLSTCLTCTGTGRFSAEGFHVAILFVALSNCLDPELTQSYLRLLPEDMGVITFSALSFFIFKALAPTFAGGPDPDPDRGPDCPPFRNVAKSMRCSGSPSIPSSSTYWLKSRNFPQVMSCLKEKGNRNSMSANSWLGMTLKLELLQIGNICGFALNLACTCFSR